jgi:hypothetical protein
MRFTTSKQDVRRLYTPWHMIPRRNDGSAFAKERSFIGNAARDWRGLVVVGLLLLLAFVA